MNERKMMQLAAKAAGMGYLIWTSGSAPIVPKEHRIDGRAAWHPISDDGDAMRLACTLRIESAPECERIGFVHAYMERHPRIEEPIANGDIRAAMRLAIVRAAAVMGLEMEDLK